MIQSNLIGMPKRVVAPPTLRQRLGLWLLGRETRASAVSKLIAQGVGSAATWSDQRFETQAKEAYLLNVIGFRAVYLVATSVAALEWQVKRRLSDGTNEDVEDDAVVEILKRPNPYESFPTFVARGISYLMLNGNLFIERITEGSITELYIHPPWRVGIELNKSTGSISNYVFKVQGQEHRWPVDSVTGESDLLHIKLFHPTDDYFGYSPMQAAAREIDTYNEATEFNKKLLENDARPGLLLMFKQVLGDDEYERIENQIKEKWSGSKNAGRAMLIEGDATVQPYGWSMHDLEFIEGNREMARRICWAVGVPPQVMGIPGDSTYSNYSEARLSFWEDTILPLGQLLAREWTRWLFEEGQEDLFIIPSADKLPAMATRKAEQWTRAQTSDFLTINEKRELCGYQPVESGDVLLVSAAMIPLEAAGESGAEEEEEQTEEEEQEARALLLARGYTNDEIDGVLDNPMPDEAKPYPNEHACRVNEPGKYKRMRRKNQTGKDPDIIYGVTTSGGVEIQAYRYPKTRFSPEEARKHCEGKGRFDAASKSCELVIAE